MSTYCFVVIGEAKGQPRPRAFARKIGGKFVARVYESGTAEHWKSQIALAAKEAGLAGAMLNGPIEFRMACVFPRPKSHFGSGRNAQTLKESAPNHFYLRKPDLDNIAKAAKDALTQVGAWKDDSQVCQTKQSKRWAEPGHEPFTFIEVSQIPDEAP